MATIKTSDFFKTMRNASEIKSEILNEYFKAWAAILLKGQQWKNIDRLIYIDLFAGSGYYSDGSPSTPIKILNSIYNSSNGVVDYNKSVQTFFNDQNEKIIKELESNIKGLPYYNELKHSPIFLNEEASNEKLDLLQKNNTKYPSLTFIDPFGYGYSKKMMLRAVKRWGSDLFLLFNMNRIRAAIKNESVESLMQGLFGKERLERLRKFYEENENAKDREEVIIKEFGEIFQERGYKYFQFRILFEKQNKTSHYLFLVSKSDIACRRMKEIMTKYSDFQTDGVPYFGVNERYNVPISDIYWSHITGYSIHDLKIDLMKQKSEFDGKTIDEVYIAHNYGTKYIKENYRKAYKELFGERRIKLWDNKKKAFSNSLTYTRKVIYQ